MFWDKLEKSNYFLENILKTLNHESDSRLIMHLTASSSPRWWAMGYVC